jgi:hypothetical protein
MFYGQDDQWQDERPGRDTRVRKQAPIAASPSGRVPARVAACILAELEKG